MWVLCLGILASLDFVFEVHCGSHYLTGEHLIVAGVFVRYIGNTEENQDEKVRGTGNYIKSINFRLSVEMFPDLDLCVSPVRNMIFLTFPEICQWTSGPIFTLLHDTMARHEKFITLCHALQPIAMRS